ncbi:MAG: hypothetical protein NT013_29510 [Planctomycetia bacterium]|nr:hypothetical protein [Planctomycetia bacterium]
MTFPILSLWVQKSLVRRDGHRMLRVQAVEVLEARCLMSADGATDGDQFEYPDWWFDESFFRGTSVTDPPATPHETDADPNSNDIPDPIVVQSEDNGIIFDDGSIGINGRGYTYGYGELEGGVLGWGYFALDDPRLIPFDMTNGYGPGSWPSQTTDWSAHFELIPLYSTLDEGGFATYQVHVNYPNAVNTLIPITILISPNFVDQSGVYTSLGDFTLTFTGVESTQTFSVAIPDNSAWQPADHIAVLALPTRDVIGLFSGTMDDIQFASTLITENDESLAPTSEEEYQAALTTAEVINGWAGSQAIFTFNTYYDTSDAYSSQLSVADTILYVSNQWGYAPFDESAFYLTLPSTHFNPNWSPEMTSPPVTPPTTETTPPPNSGSSNNSSSNTSPPSPDTTVIPPTNSGSYNSSPPTPDPLLSTPPISGNSSSSGGSSSGNSSGDPGTYSTGNNSSSSTTYSNSSSSSGSGTSSTSGSNTSSGSSGTSASPGNPLTSGIWSSMNSGNSSSTNPLLV